MSSSFYLDLALQCSHFVDSSWPEIIVFQPFRMAILVSRAQKRMLLPLQALLRLYLQKLQSCIPLSIVAPLEAMAYRLVDLLTPVVVVSPVVVLIASGPTTLWINAWNFTASQPGAHLLHPLRMVYAWQHLVFGYSVNSSRSIGVFHYACWENEKLKHESLSWINARFVDRINRIMVGVCSPSIGDEHGIFTCSVSF